jgi:hypothetical protein
MRYEPKVVMREEQQGATFRLLVVKYVVKVGSYYEVLKDFGRRGVSESRSGQYHRAQGVKPEAIRFPKRGTGL